MENQLVILSESLDQKLSVLADIQAYNQKQEKAFRDQKKPEEATRIRRAVGELVESLKEGFDVQMLDAYIRYFCKDTVSFLDYMKEVGAKVTLVSSTTETGKQTSGLALILDEPQRMKEKAETVETEEEKPAKARAKGKTEAKGKAKTTAPEENPDTAQNVANEMLWQPEERDMNQLSETMRQEKQGGERK